MSVEEQQRLVLETMENVRRLKAELPPEKPVPRMIPITFDEAVEQQGLAAIFVAGRVRPTDNERVTLVPERTINILDKLGIPYTRVTDQHAVPAPPKRRGTPDGWWPPLGMSSGVIIGGTVGLLGSGLLSILVGMAAGGIAGYLLERGFLARTKSSGA